MKQEMITSTVLDTLKEQLLDKKTKGELSHWSVLARSIKRNNIYIEKEYQVESILEGHREEYDVIIYKEDEDTTYQSSFTLFENSTDQDIEEQLTTALFTCQFAQSKRYNLPKTGDETLNDMHIDYSSFYKKDVFEDISQGSIHLFLEKKLQEFKELIENSQTNQVNIHLNNLELLTTALTNSLYTSEDVEKTFAKDKAYLEFVLTAKDTKTKRETEHIIYEHINSLYDFDFTSFFKQSLITVVDTTKATKAPSFKGPVLLVDVALKDYFTPDLTMNALIAHASAKLKYDELSKYELDKEILESNGDKLTIYANPLLENNEASTPFDMLGISAKRTCLIENNIVKNFFASKQYADYLNILPTGPVGTIEIEPGSFTLEELKNKDYYVEIHTFSSFVPDVASGSFSAEIRLGYVVKNGERTPFKGGLFSGNIFELAKNMNLSKEEQLEAGYKGPKAALFLEGEVVGE